MHSLKSINYKLLVILILTFLLPSIYKAFRIYLLGDLPSDWGINIASQLAWLNVIYEVIQETLILPLFFLIGKSLKNHEDLKNKIKTGIMSSFAIYFVLSVVLILSSEHLLIFLGQKESIVSSSCVYIRIEAVAILFSILYKFISIVFVVLEKNHDLLKLLFLQTVFTVVSDALLVSNLPISLHLGVNGIAIGNIVINLLMFFMGILLLKHNGLNIFEKTQLSFSWQKEWWRVGWKSGLESFIRNGVFIIMILKMINLVHEQGNFWISLNFIWGWLLIPILAIGELIKKNIGSNLNQNHIKNNINSYYIITSFFVLLWIITIPFYNFFLAKVMNVQETETVFHIILYSLIFYVLFAYNNILDSILYGAGRTDLMLYQSLIVNILIFGSSYVLFQIGIFKPTLYKIIFLFGSAIAFDTIITFLIFYYLYFRYKLIRVP